MNKILWVLVWLLYKWDIWVSIPSSYTWCNSTHRGKNTVCQYSTTSSAFMTVNVLTCGCFLPAVAYSPHPLLHLQTLANWLHQHYLVLLSFHSSHIFNNIHWKSLLLQLFWQDFAVHFFIYSLPLSFWITALSFIFQILVINFASQLLHKYHKHNLNCPSYLTQMLQCSSCILIASPEVALLWLLHNLRYSFMNMVNCTSSHCIPYYSIPSYSMSTLSVTLCILPAGETVDTHWHSIIGDLNISERPWERSIASMRCNCKGTMAEWLDVYSKWVPQGCCKFNPPDGQSFW
jgi:hypothetical protein